MLRLSDGSTGPADINFILQRKKDNEPPSRNHNRICRHIALVIVGHVDDGNLANPSAAAQRRLLHHRRLYRTGVDDKRGNFRELANVRWTVYVFGSLGLLGYHILYFYALRLAPAAEASLIAYLWPLLIVLFSSLLPGESFRAGHLVGALLSFAGAAMIILNKSISFDPEHVTGFILASLCALTWSSYSVLSRRLGEVPTETVFVFCFATAIVSWVFHFSLEDTVLPQTGMAWAALLLLGAGPVGAAFYFWDIGVKRGDIQLLGTASYAAPLLSTLVLVATGRADLSAMLIAAAILISVGAVIAARASMLRTAVSTS